VKVLTSPGKIKYGCHYWWAPVPFELLAEFVISHENWASVLNQITRALSILPGLWLKPIKNVAGNWKKAMLRKKILALLERFHTWPASVKR